MVWLCSAAVVLSLLLLFGLVGLLAVRGTAHFWPQPLHLLQAPAPGTPAYLGWIVDREEHADGSTALLLYRGSRDRFSNALVWIEAQALTRRSRPEDALVVERRGAERLFGFFDALSVDGSWQRFEELPPAARHESVRAALAAGVEGEGNRPAELRLRLSTGELARVPLADVQTLYAPNAMGSAGKLAVFSAQLAAFLR